MTYKYIFWDWNGTLLDDAEAAWKAVNIMLETRSRPLISFQQYKEYIDVPIIRFYEKVMDMSKEDMNSISKEFDSLWRKNLSKCPIAAGGREILERAASLGIEQYIFSSSRNELIEPLLKKFSLSRYFKSVLGAPDRYVGSKAERTKKYITDNSIPVNEILFVGDMLHDLEVADYVGADCILIANGHQCRSSLENSGKTVLTSLSELILN